MTTDALDDFKAHIATRRIAKRIAIRFAGEFTENEWKAYQKEHPGANPKDHDIKKVEDKPKEEAAPEKKDDAVDEAAEKIRPTEEPEESIISMTFGDMPDKGDFIKHITTAIDEDNDEPWLPEGKPFKVELKGADSELANLLDIEADGEWDVDELYENVRKLKDFADQDDEWYTEEHDIDEGDVEEMRDAAMGLASSVMGQLGYEWI